MMTRDVRNQSFAPGEDGGLGAIHQLQLAQDIADVTFHGFLTDDQPPGDFPVGESFGDEPQDLAFAFAQHRVLLSAGITRSINTISGARSAATRTASPPEPTSPTTVKSGCASRKARAPSRTTAWSSTIRIVIGSLIDHLSLLWLPELLQAD